MIKHNESHITNTTINNTSQNSFKQQTAVSWVSGDSLMTKRKQKKQAGKCSNQVKNASSINSKQMNS